MANEIPMLVTLAEAKDHLRYDHDAFDTDLTAKLLAAEVRVRKHCDTLDFSDLDALDPLDKMLVKAAILMMVGYLDRIRNGEEVQSQDRFWLPAAVHQLLVPYHTPAVA